MDLLDNFFIRIESTLIKTVRVLKKLKKLNPVFYIRYFTLGDIMNFYIKLIHKRSIVPVSSQIMFLIDNLI